MTGQPNEFHGKGHLAQDWADWLENMRRCCLENGEMTLCGMPVDQAALMDVLNEFGCLDLAALFAGKTGGKDPEPAGRNETENLSE